MAVEMTALALVTTKTELYRAAMKIAARQGCQWDRRIEPRQITLIFHYRNINGFSWHASFEFHGLPGQGLSTSRMVTLEHVILEAEIDGTRVDHEITSKPVSSFEEIADLVAAVQGLESLFSDHEQ